MSKTILHLTTGHSSFDDRIFYKEARSLAKKYNVAILAPSVRGKLRNMSNHYFDEGKYDGVLQLGYSFAGNKFVAKVFKKLRINLYSVIYKKIVEHKLKPDLVHFHEPELLPVAKKLKKKFGCRLIFDAHEMHLAYPLDKYISPLSHLRVYTKALFLKKYYKHLDAVISVNPIIKGLNVALNPGIRHRIIYNCSIFKKKGNPVKDSKKLMIIHEGSISFGRGFKLMVDLFEDSWIKNNVSLRILGQVGGKEKKYLASKIAKHPWLKDRISETGWVDYLDVPKYLDGDMGIIFMEPLYNNLLAGPPNKLFNYVAFDMPVLSFEIPASSDIIRENDIGVISLRDIDSIKAGIKTISKDKELYIKNIKKIKPKLSWENEEKKLFDLYAELL